MLAEKNINTKVKIKEKARHMGKLVKSVLSAKGKVTPTAPYDFVTAPQTPSIPKRGALSSKQDVHTELIYIVHAAKRR